MSVHLSISINSHKMFWAEEDVWSKSILLLQKLQDEIMSELAGDKRRQRVSKVNTVTELQDVMERNDGWL